jgi:hypothetical protein
MESFPHSKDRVSIPLTLVSNQTSTNPTNSSYKFRNELVTPLRINPGEKWEVSLVSISFPVPLQETKKKYFKYGETTKEPSDENIIELQALKNLKDFNKYDKIAENIFYEPNTFYHGKNIINELNNIIEEMHEYIKTQINALKIGDDLNPMKRREKRKFKITKTRYKKYQKLRNTFLKHYRISKYSELLELDKPVFIEMKEISENENGNQNIASFRYKENQPYSFYQPKIKEYFPIQNNYLNKCSIVIKDANGNILEGKCSENGFPTIIHLRIRKIMPHKRYEYRSCYIENDKNSNPNNFYASLPSYLEHMGESSPWEMALLKCVIPKYFRALPEPLTFKVIERHRAGHFATRALEDLSPAELLNHLEESQADPEYFYSSQIKTFEDNPIKEDIIEIFESVFLELNTFGINEKHRYFGKIILETIDNEEYLSIESNRNLIFVLPTIIAGAYGIEKIVKIDETYCCFQLFDTWGDTFPQTRFMAEINLPHNFGQVVERERKRYAFNGDCAIDMRLILHSSVVITANCIEPTLCGKRFGQFLSHVPIFHDNRHFTEYKTLHPEYHKLCQTNMNHVTFKIENMDGSIPKLVYQNLIKNYKTYIYLSFRKRI